MIQGRVDQGTWNWSDSTPRAQRNFQRRHRLQNLSRVLAEGRVVPVVIRAGARAHAAPDVVDQDVRGSAWRTLRRFPVQLVELDCRFVAGLDRHPAGDALMRSVVDRAHVLGIHALRIGVETAAHAEILRSLGCDAAQG